MDREYCLRRRDEELANASKATCEEARVAHQALARHFEDAAERAVSPVPVAALVRNAQPVAQA